MQNSVQSILVNKSLLKLADQNWYSCLFLICTRLSSYIKILHEVISKMSWFKYTEECCWATRSRERCNIRGKRLRRCFRQQTCSSFSFLLKWNNKAQYLNTYRIFHILLVPKQVVLMFFGPSFWISLVWRLRF